MIARISEVIYSKLVGTMKRKRGEIKAQEKEFMK